MSTLSTTNIKHPSSASNNVVLDSSGQVGIGTASPAAKLEVQAASTPEIKIRNTTTSSFSSLHLAEVGDTGTFVVNRLGSASTATGGARAGQIWNSANAPIVFGTNGTESARITATGNLQFNSGYGSVATAYGCRAWVSFDGTNNSIHASGNVSSITNAGTADYTVNFTSAMPDNDYASCGMVGDNGNVNSNVSTWIRNTNKLTSSTRFSTGYATSAGSFNGAYQETSFVIFR